MVVVLIEVVVVAVLIEVVVVAVLITVVEVVVVAVLIEAVVVAVLITEEEESIKSPPGGFSPRYKFSPKSKNNLSASCAQINISKTCRSQEFFLDYQTPTEQK